MEFYATSGESSSRRKVVACFCFVFTLQEKKIPLNQVKELHQSRVAWLKFERAREIENLCAGGNRYSIDLEVKNKLGSLCLVSLEGLPRCSYIWLCLSDL